MFLMLGSPPFICNVVFRLITGEANPLEDGDRKDHHLGIWKRKGVIWWLHVAELESTKGFSGLVVEPRGFEMPKIYACWHLR
jgi:hypothetical protein